MNSVHNNYNLTIFKRRNQEQFLILKRVAKWIVMWYKFSQ